MDDVKAAGRDSVSWAMVALVFLAWLKDIYSWGYENCLFYQDLCVLDDEVGRAVFKVGHFPAGYRQCEYLSSSVWIYCEEMEDILSLPSVLEVAVVF